MQLFVNDLTVMDFSYLCAERGMVGESWIVDVLLDGALNDESMIQDFGKVKKDLKRLIDEYVDHKLLVPADYAQTRVIHDENSAQVEVQFRCHDGRQFMLSSPADAYAFVYAPEVTMTSVSDYLKEVLATHLPDNVDDIELILRTEVIDTPFYHYTHGLKKHDGNCQRIAHGHRSKIDIFIDGVSCLESQNYWAQRWKDIYIATREDQVDLADTCIQGEISAPENYHCFAYEASQGRFEIILPKSDCEIIDTDSTVECLAQYIFQHQKQRRPEGKCKVLAYEGVGKGAMISE
ncbi:hypothetical protein DXV75_08025 [Alteromonas aestuariivivens]|uniref:6-carboxy-5,6,7,8-tetrahydropterin synthase n=1 Tax=Alteromonas aestuariivivens TaxID=1938339 RepID=A0A3D8M8H1_9ALTE|nr:6-carboxytetrahydropterin synthase [Alteromonas aestuariivivens]RDV26022.1 hypothetical protein DXV75_08025 [Alteromonas aestuariivivens]